MKSRARSAPGREAAADRNLHATARDVVDLMLLGGAGEVGCERSRVQIPRLQGQRPEALLFTIGGGATRPQGGARSAEEQRAREREQP